MKKIISITIKVLLICVVLVINHQKIFAQNKDTNPTPNTAPAESRNKKEVANYEDIEELEEDSEPKASENPFETMMSSSMSTTDLTGGTMGGIMSSENLEYVMSNYEADSASLKFRDTLIRYNAVVDKNIKAANFNYMGMWKIVYKEQFSSRIVPIKTTYNQKMCINEHNYLGKRIYLWHHNLFKKFSLF